MIWVWLSAWVREFTPLQNVQMQLWCPPSILFGECRLHFPQRYSSWGMEFTTHLQLVSRLWMSGAVLHTLISWHAHMWFYLYFKHVPVLNVRMTAMVNWKGYERKCSWSDLSICEWTLFLNWSFSFIEFLISLYLVYLSVSVWECTRHVEKIHWTLQKVISVTETEMCCICILPAEDEGTFWRVWGKWWNVGKMGLQAGIWTGTIWTQTSSLVSKNPD